MGFVVQNREYFCFGLRFLGQGKTLVHNVLDTLSLVTLERRKVIDQQVALSRKLRLGVHYRILRRHRLKMFVFIPGGRQDTHALIEWHSALRSMVCHRV